ncbi:MAG: hypothetical protein K8R56_09125 [Candidatus Eisenbacteria bacterium]|nr:hypothetical protein [Candidatus Eisenbacteria bacterium]
MSALAADPTFRFGCMIAASCLVFMGTVWLVLRRREQGPELFPLLMVAAVVVAGGMSFARWGQNTGLPWGLYYTIPAALTWCVPPFVWRMRRGETVRYLVLSVLSAPAIHVTFALVLGWKEYMPFLPVPSLAELLQR